MEKSLDRKLQTIWRDPNAKESSSSPTPRTPTWLSGSGRPGRSPEAHPGEVRARSLKEFRDVIREIVRQELVDIMLMSSSTSEVLTIHERLFDDSPVTPAVRTNDTTDIWVVRGGKFVSEPARPFRSASIDHIQCGRQTCAPEERVMGANLGLYSVTFNNSTEHDLITLEAFREFRHEAERKGFRYFLEVFDPNLGDSVAPADAAHFVNDMIARCLAGVSSAGRPLFLKMVYHGPQAMEELFHYDPTLVIGVLGGSAGTTYDALQADRRSAEVRCQSRPLRP